MQWLIPVILAALCFGLYNFCIKVASGQIHEMLGAAILQAVALGLGVIALVFLKTKGAVFHSSPKGFGYAMAAGLFVGLAEILSFYAFSKGLPASVGIPVIVGGTLLTGILLGQWVLKETLSPLQYLAIAMIISGALILAFKK
ncbi:MAG: EamA family transporter [Bacteroidota bacterium]